MSGWSNPDSGDKPSILLNPKRSGILEDRFKNSRYHARLLSMRMDHGNVNKRLTVSGQDFIIFGMDSIIEQPSKGSFDHPSALKYSKAGGLFF